MDPAAFTPAAPGEVVETRFPTRIPGEWANDHAFVPNPLPPEWKFPATLWPLLAEAKEGVALLEGLGRTLPNPAILLRPLRTREAVLSSRLEGTYVTARQVLLFELEGGADLPDPTETEERNDQREVANYAAAMTGATVGLGTGGFPLSKSLVRQLHHRLMTGVRGQDRHPGKFREVQVVIGTDRRFIPPPADRLTDCLDALDAYLQQEVRPYDPLVDAFLTHYQFEAIHPFEDGNGRVGRLLLALCFPRWGRLTEPWIYMSPYFERHRREYVDRMFAVSTHGDWNGWIEFCLRGVVETADETARRCDALRLLREEVKQKASAAGRSGRLLQIAERLFESPMIRVTKLAEELNVVYDTAAADCRKLVRAGVLEELPGIHPKTYFSPKVIELAYDVDRSGGY